MVGYIIDSTALAIIIAWILSHVNGFGQVLDAVSAATVGSVQTLWNR